MDFKNLKGFLDMMVREERTPGCAIVVYKGGKRVYEYAAGFSDIESGEKMTGGEHFCIYSCSKVTTATAGLQLIEKGILDANAPLYDYIPEYRHMAVKTENGIEEAKNPILVGDLFSMSAGFDYNFNCDAFNKMVEDTNQKGSTALFAKYMSDSVLCFEPGTRWQYSLCHDVLGGLISTVTGESFGGYVKNNIFDPLGITGSTYNTTPELEANMASQYKFIPRDPNQQNLSLVEAQMFGNAREGRFEKLPKLRQIGGCNLPEFESGGAGIITTAGEYAKIAAALSCDGLGANGERILSPHGVELMKTNRLNDVQLKDFNWKQLAGYGYGMGVRTHVDRAKSGSLANLGEFGWGGAAGATIIMDTEEQLGVFFVQHTLNPREEWYQPRLRNVVYSCLD